MGEYYDYSDFGGRQNFENMTRNASLLGSNHSQDWMAAISEDHFGNVLYSIVVPVLFSIVTVTGVAGNSLVIWIISTDLKMRTVINLLLLNLAIADLAFVLICPPFTAYEWATMSFPFDGILGNIMCKVMHYLLNVTAYITIYTLVLIAVIRYLTIVHSATTTQYRSKMFITKLIITIWIVMLVLNSPILAVYSVEINPYSGALDCVNFGRHVGQNLYATFFVFAYLLPLLVIAGLSVKILCHINGRRQSETFQQAQAAVDAANRKRLASRLLIIVIAVFAVFWFPVHIHLLVAHFGKLPQSDFYRTMGVLFTFLAYFNSCVNPIIYNCTSHEFRSSFRRVLCCTRGHENTSMGGAEDLHLMSIAQNQDHRLCASGMGGRENGKVESNGSKFVHVQTYCNKNGQVKVSAVEV